MPRYGGTTKEEFYAGFDLSLTASGIVILNSKGEVKERHVIKVKTKGAERLDNIQQQIRTIIAAYNIKLVCIEGYATGAVGKTYHIGELGGVIRLLLYRMNISYIDPKPTQLKLWATGKGGGEGASKDQVTMFVYKNWDFQAVDNNEADAYVLARIALALGGNTEGLTKYQHDVLQKIISPPVKSKKKGKDNGD